VPVSFTLCVRKIAMTANFKLNDKVIK